MALLGFKPEMFCRYFISNCYILEVSRKKGLMMSERDYRLVLGSVILAGLYFTLAELIYAVVLVLLMEGVFNFRLVSLLPYLMQQGRGMADWSGTEVRYEFSAERAWRILFALGLFLSFEFYTTYWAISWFLGFAVFGAGASGVCPMLMLFKWAGFR